MSRKIFVNLCIKDLKKSINFYEKLGFKLNPQFSDDTAACMVLSEEIFVMILSEPKFKSFTQKKIIDAKTSIEVMNALSADSKAEVETMAKNAVAGGGTAKDAQDLGFMYTRTLEDPDGHIWEVFWMDPASVKS